MSFSVADTINTPSRVQWSVPVVGKGGLIFVAWVSDDPTSIRSTRSIDGGESFETEDTLFFTSFYFDFLSPVSYKVYPYPSMDADLTGGIHHGNIYMAFADRRDASDVDIYFSRSTDDGLAWSTPVRLNNDPIGNGVEQFHPWINVNPYGVITVVFLDQRVPPDSQYFMNLFLTCSFDGGMTFTPNQRVSIISSDIRNNKMSTEHKSAWDAVDMIALDPQAGVFGEYIGVTASAQLIHALWTDTRDSNQNAYTAAVPIGYHMPELVCPGYGETFLENPSHFFWTPVVSQDSMPTFRLEVSTDSTFTIVDQLNAEGLTHNYYVFANEPSLSTGKYYWRVIDSLPDGSLVGYEIVSCFEVFTCGDLDSSGDDPNVADLTYLVDYFFRGGPPPPVMETANVDGVNGVNMADLTYFVGYLFRGGPAPACTPVD
jgi:hypothetical protein